MLVWEVHHLKDKWCRKCCGSVFFIDLSWILHILGAYFLKGLDIMTKTGIYLLILYSWIKLLWCQLRNFCLFIQNAEKFLYSWFIGWRLSYKMIKLEKILARITSWRNTTNKCEKLLLWPLNANSITFHISLSQEYHWSSNTEN